MTASRPSLDSAGLLWQRVSERQVGWVPSSTRSVARRSSFACSGHSCLTVSCLKRNALQASLLTCYPNFLMGVISDPELRVKLQFPCELLTHDLLRRGIKGITCRVLADR